MTTPQIHQPLSSFVSLAKRSSLGTRNSVPDPDRLGFSSIIQKGNTDTMSMNSMPVKTRVVVTDSMTVQFRTTAIAVENLQYARPSSALGPHSSIQIGYLDPSRLPLTYLQDAALQEYCSVLNMGEYGSDTQGFYGLQYNIYWV